MDPSALVGTCPEITTRLPRTLIRLAGTTTPGGRAHGLGKVMPSSSRRRSIFDMVLPNVVVLEGVVPARSARTSVRRPIPPTAGRLIRGYGAPFLSPHGRRIVQGGHV